MEAQLCYKQLADVCNLIVGSINTNPFGESIVRADPYNPEGSTAAVSFTTTQTDRYWPRPDRSHVNWIVTDSGWEAQLAQAIEDHPRTLAYAKNHNLGFEIPYLYEAEPHRYPDYLVRLATGATLVLEVKGFRGHDAAIKAATMRDKWIPAVNRLGRFGTWTFAKMRDPFTMADELGQIIDKLSSEGVAA